MEENEKKIIPISLDDKLDSKSVKSKSSLNSNESFSVSKEKIPSSNTSDLKYSDRMSISEMNSKNGSMNDMKYQTVNNSNTVNKLIKESPLIEISNKNNSVKKSINLEEKVVNFTGIKDKYKKIDTLKKIEEDIVVDNYEPIQMLFYTKLNSLLCCSDKKKFEYYKFVDEQYDHHFEFHNIMILENKIDIMSNGLFAE